MSQKTFEIEFRALLSQEKYRSLLAFLSANAQDLGTDDKRVWFFVMSDKLLKVTHNISIKNGKITLKLTKIGEGSSFEEIEFLIAEADIPKSVELFSKLGHEYLLEPTILRHNYLFKGVELAVKYSKSWGYHVELEIIINNQSDKQKAEATIREVAAELGIEIMTDEELKTFTQNIEANYTHPPENTPQE